MLASDVKGIREQAIKRLCDHGSIGRALKQLQRGWGHAEAILEVVADPKPREAPKTLHPEPHGRHPSHHRLHFLSLSLRFLRAHEFFAIIYIKIYIMWSLEALSTGPNGTLWTASDGGDGGAF